MIYSENAKNFYRQYLANSGSLIVWIACSEESEMYKAAKELRDTGVISIEVGQVVDADNVKICNRLGIVKRKDLFEAE
jgi:hypothetical protein